MGFRKVCCTFEAEKQNYKKILQNHETVFSGRLEDLAKQFDMDPVTFTGFLDGANTSFQNGELDLESLTEDTELSLAFDFDRLYINAGGEELGRRNEHGILALHITEVIELLDSFFIVGGDAHHVTIVHGAHIGIFVDQRTAHTVSVFLIHAEKYSFIQGGILLLLPPAFYPRGENAEN